MGYDVTFHPVVVEDLLPCLTPPSPPAARARLAARIRRGEELRLCATVVANALGPSEGARFAAEHRPFFILEDDPRSLSATLGRLESAPDIVEIVAIMLASARPVYPQEMKPLALLKRFGISPEGVEVELSFDEFIASMLKGLQSGDPDAAAQFAYDVATLARRAWPAWYTRNVSLSHLYDHSDDLRPLCGAFVDELADRAPAPPTHFEANHEPGVYIPARNIAPLVNLVRKGRVREAAASLDWPPDQIACLEKVLTEACVYALHNKAALLEATDIVQSMMMGRQMPT